VAEQTKLPQAGPTRPLGSTDIPQLYLPGPKVSGKVTYTPYLYGSAGIQFADKRRGVDEERKVQVLLPLEPSTKTVDWEQAKSTEFTQEQLLKEAPKAGDYQPLPAAATKTLTFTRWAKQFDRWLSRTQRVTLMSKTDPPEPAEVRPKRGGVNVNLVAIVWEAKSE
jgi:hypothetical protein